MGYIPENAKWYVAELIEEITVQDGSTNVVHINTVLIRADSPDEAYEKATVLGRKGETSYLNPHDKLVQLRFRGISNLDVVHDELEHGAELWFRRKTGLSESDINKLIRKKEELEVFLPPRPSGGPDYAAKDVIQEVNDRWGPYPELVDRYSHLFGPANNKSIKKK